MANKPQYKNPGKVAKIEGILKYLEEARDFDYTINHDGKKTSIVIKLK